MAAASITSRSVRRLPRGSSTWPSLKSSPARRMCRPARSGVIDDHALAVARGVLLDHDGVGAGRDDAAGEDARGLAGAHLALERMAGRDLARDLERHRHARHIGGAHRIAVHGGEIGRRLRAQRRDVRRPAPGRRRRSAAASSRGSGSTPSSTRASASATDNNAAMPTPWTCDLDGRRRGSGRTCRPAFRAAGCLRSACPSRPP